MRTGLFISVHMCYGGFFWIFNRETGHGKQIKITKQKHESDQKGHIYKINPL